jgi:hypothetical protein
VQGGVTGADIQMCTMYDGGDGFVFAPQKGTHGLIEDVAVTHFTATTGIQNTVVFEGSRPYQTLRNCHVRGNFLVNGGAMNKEGQAAGLLVRGPVAPRLLDTTVAFQVRNGAQRHLA